MGKLAMKVQKNCLTVLLTGGLSIYNRGEVEYLIDSYSTYYEWYTQRNKGANEHEVLIKFLEKTVKIVSKNGLDPRSVCSFCEIVQHVYRIFSLESVLYEVEKHTQLDISYLNNYRDAKPVVGKSTSTVASGHYSSGGCGVSSFGC